ncbi:response regulator transcription factor [Amycolatopsis sp. Hca4]|uniref:response regulator transcription factor n=1 Tax=Amycolatopsis sp. Hca4 TaxID=2742131 RepID=UPI001590EF1F|nr:response regulator transcription factor [Amycolatopsis sp. Hca4]QKV73912.1 response regulator transcription factor [Amycolatopsis sp. Hca4]
MTAILIWDKRKSVRRGLTRLLSGIPGVSRVDCVADGDELLRRHSRERGDVVFVGTMSGPDRGSCPDVAKVVSRLVVADPQAYVVALGEQDVGDTKAIVESGVRGYVRWNVTEHELVAALAHIVALASVSVAQRLRPRELEVLRGMAAGNTNMAIARQMGISEDTVKSHARTVFRKLEVKERAHAVAEGFRRGLLR